MTDPFATETSLDDLFAAPATEFVEIADLDGRLVSIFPKQVAQGVGKSDGKPYDKVIADVIVHSGETTDKIHAVPFTIADMHFSSKMVVGQLRPFVGKGRPVLAKVDSKPSQFNKNVKAYALAAGGVTDQDRRTAEPAVREYMAEQAKSVFAN